MAANQKEKLLQETIAHNIWLAEQYIEKINHIRTGMYVHKMCQLRRKLIGYVKSLKKSFDKETFNKMCRARMEAGDYMMLETMKLYEKPGEGE